MAKLPSSHDSDKSSASGKNNDSGFISWLYGLVLGGSDPERNKRRLLKALAKEFGRVRYKFYRPKGSLALPSLAKFFFECYKVTSNASVILQNSDKSAALKSLCIEHFLLPEQREFLEHFGEEYIREQSKTTEPKELAARLKDDLVGFFASFDNQRVSKINEIYTLLGRFLRFINFDFYFVLKKFDSGLAERTFSASPKFESINAEYLIDDIRDFQEVVLTMDKQEDWSNLFDVLKRYKGLDPIDRSEWTRILNVISAINQSDVLSMIVRHASEDPYYKPSPDRAAQRIVEPYIEKTRVQVESVIQKIVVERRDAQIDKLCVTVFGSREVNRTRYYTEASNAVFSKKMSAGFTQTAPLNYMKAFLLDYFKKDVRELQELILVRGKWASNIVSQQLSDVYYLVLSISEQIIAFDESLSDEAEYGLKVRKAMGRVVDRDTSSGNSLRQILQEVNDRATKIVNDGAQALILFGKYLRTTLEDIGKKDHEIIINWKELETLSEVPLKTRMAEVYRKLYYFIQLMQVFAKSGIRTTSPTKTEVNVPDEEEV